MDISNSSNISGAFASGLQGVQRGNEQVTQASSDIANLTSASAQGSSTGVNLSDSVVELKTGALGVEASAKVLSVANDTLGTLLDTFA
ncbi:hypothetical protein FX988_02720 [Paraglaciecola mesophila]|uniref:Pyrroloquinoline quinone biosynthesis protein PqqE n=1 Tax=Paraglaciecola mesophila TaxID=197222 RepID=A0A857JKP1_9ALTE|nr:hypothetical protein [Paraglaciecola mesophila]QHJ12463.1 hypothetical protein FX988_02720 [Paraglaciecola mesophila]